MITRAPTRQAERDKEVKHELSVRIEAESKKAEERASRIQIETEKDAAH
jgi:hypothetical protein